MRGKKRGMEGKQEPVRGVWRREGKAEGRGGDDTGRSEGRGEGKEEGRGWS